MKPRIFIGSSREGYNEAKKVKKELSDVADCQIWDEGFFENNGSSFTSLSESSTLFDFAILVATQDDIQLKRHSIQTITRDNVIFEFGLYVGRLGKNRCFFFKEEGIDLPTDLFGITLPEFILDKHKPGKTIEMLCNEFKQFIIQSSNIYELSFVPSSVLALGYFQNLVAPICRELIQSSKREVNGKYFSDFSFHIIIPDELPNDFRDQVRVYLHEKNLTEMSVNTDTRKYNFHVDYSENTGDILQLYDLPTTLSALQKAIEMAIPKTFIGESQREIILKRKEMMNFFKTLSYLINENPITSKKVLIEFIDVKS